MDASRHPSGSVAVEGGFIKSHGTPSLQRCSRLEDMKKASAIGRCLAGC